MVVVGMLSEGIDRKLRLLISSSKTVLLITRVSVKLIAGVYSLFISHLASLSKVICKCGKARRPSIDALGVVYISAVFVCWLVSLIWSFVGACSTTLPIRM